jgi:hypothetical protein
MRFARRVIFIAPNDAIAELLVKSSGLKAIGCQTARMASTPLGLFFSQQHDLRSIAFAARSLIQLKQRDVQPAPMSDSYQTTKKTTLSISYR